MPLCVVKMFVYKAVKPQRFCILLRYKKKRLRLRNEDGSIKMSGN